MVEEQFNKYVEYVKNSQQSDSKKAITDDIRLLFYKYYKQAINGDCNTACPGMFDFAGRAKWNAWNDIKGMSKDEAMKKYIYYAKMHVEL